MKILIEVNDYYDLKRRLWAGALDTLEEIEAQGKENELLPILESMFCDDVEPPTLTAVNDLIWFCDDCLNDILGLYQDKGED